MTPATFDLDDDADGALLNTQTFSDGQPGIFTVSELVVIGYTTTILRIDPEGRTTVTENTVTIGLTLQVTVTCTFTNNINEETSVSQSVAQRRVSLEAPVHLLAASPPALVE